MYIVIWWSCSRLPNSCSWLATWSSQYHQPVSHVSSQTMFDLAKSFRPVHLQLKGNVS
jgi:hypothetical protein